MNVNVKLFLDHGIEISFILPSISTDADFQELKESMKQAWKKEQFFELGDFEYRCKDIKGMIVTKDSN